jgi:hypothetical protein
VVPPTHIRQQAGTRRVMDNHRVAGVADSRPAAVAVADSHPAAVAVVGSYPVAEVDSRSAGAAADNRPVGAAAGNRPAAVAD